MRPVQMRSGGCSFCQRVRNALRIGVPRITKSFQFARPRERSGTDTFKVTNPTPSKRDNL